MPAAMPYCARPAHLIWTSCLGLTMRLAVEDDNVTLSPPSPRSVSEGETDEEAGELARGLAAHFLEIDRMGLPTIPKPLQDQEGLCVLSACGTDSDDCNDAIEQRSEDLALKGSHAECVLLTAISVRHGGSGVQTEQTSTQCWQRNTNL